MKSNCLAPYGLRAIRLIRLFILIRFVLSDSSCRVMLQDKTKRISAGTLRRSPEAGDGGPGLRPWSNLVQVCARLASFRDVCGHKAGILAIEKTAFDPEMAVLKKPSEMASQRLAGRVGHFIRPGTHKSILLRVSSARSSNPRISSSVT